MEYVPNPQERIVIYRRIARIDKNDDIKRIKEELVDRYGRIPEVVEVLMRISELRMLGLNRGIENLYFKNSEVILEFYSDAPPDPKNLAKIKEEYKDTVRFKQNKRFSVFLCKD